MCVGIEAVISHKTTKQALPSNQSATARTHEKAQFAVLYNPILLQVNLRLKTCE